MSSSPYRSQRTLLRNSQKPSQERRFLLPFEDALLSKSIILRLLLLLLRHEHVQDSNGWYLPTLRLAKLTTIHGLLPLR